MSSTYGPTSHTTSCRYLPSRTKRPCEIYRVQEIRRTVEIHFFFLVNNFYDFESHNNICLVDTETFISLPSSNVLTFTVFYMTVRNSNPVSLLYHGQKPSVPDNPTVSRIWTHRIKKRTLCNSRDLRLSLSLCHPSTRSESRNVHLPRLSRRRTSTKVVLGVIWIHPTIRTKKTLFMY